MAGAGATAATAAEAVPWWLGPTAQSAYKQVGGQLTSQLAARGLNPPPPALKPRSYLPPPAMNPTIAQLLYADQQGGM